MATAVEQNPNYASQADNTNIDHIPGDMGWIPWLGNTLNWVEDLYGFIDKAHAKYGEVSKIKIGGQSGLMVVGAENYKKIYLDKDKNFSTMMGYENSLNHFYRGGLLMRDFDDHRFQRRMFQTAFKNEPMKGYISIMNPALKTHINDWANDKDFRFFLSIKKALLDVGARTFIGVQESGEEMDKMNEAFCNINEQGLMSLVKKDIPGLKFHKGMQGKRYIDTYLEKLIPVRRAGDGGDMMSFVCKETQDDGSYFPDADLIPQLSFLLFAAHDTTTSVLTHIIYHTAKNPEWQERLRKEAQALGKDQLEYEDLDNMTDMELVFKEALRMNPSVSLMARRTIADCQIGDYKVPANTMIFLPPGFNHRMEEYWTNPHTFDPERFAPGREEHKNHSFCYMPFGGGAHKCIGMHFANMQAKCFMHQFLLNYRYSVPADYNPKMEAFPLPKTADNLPIKLERI